MTQPLLPSSEALFRIAVESSPTGLLVVGSDGAILLVNHEIERLFGYPRGELLGRSVETLVPERFRARHPLFRDGYVADAKARPMGAGRELYGLHRNGSEIPIEIGLNPVRIEGTLLVLASIVDITARRRIEHQLLESQRLQAIGTLAGGIAHDFNNILTGMIGHTELALAAVGNGTQAGSDLAQVLKAGERARQLIQRILDFSRRREVPRAPLRLLEPVREALQLVRATLPASVEIREALFADTPMVVCDGTEIYQVLMNLATNAAHAMPEGGVLDVRLGPVDVSSDLAARRPDLVPGRHALLTVSDTGHGMSTETLERAFDPFYTTKPAGQGTGLGLPVIRDIVQALGGTIEIQSEPGQGTRVAVYLPAAAQREKFSTASTVNEGANAGARHILLVEDEEFLRSMLARQLEDLGYRVTAHGSSVEALEDFRGRTADFDALLTDNSMPGMTGIALAEKLVALRPGLPVLLMSGLARHADPDEMAARGIRFLLPKPYTGAELADAVRRMMAG
jgi:hypothetical protein